MGGLVCAYCDSSFFGYRSDIDHFRPKSLYWWLAYDFGNYLLSCRECNQVGKKGDFPLREGTERCSYLLRERLHEERYLLLNPEEDDVEAWIWVADRNDVSRLVPSPDLPAGSEPYERVLKTIAVFGLNEHGRIADTRTLAVERLGKILEDIRNGRRERAFEARMMASRFRPHGGAIRNFLVQNRELELIPTPKEELLHLLADLADEWRRAEMRHANEVDSEIIAKERAEILWAFAVLWRHPPGEHPELVERFLDKRGLRVKVAPFYAEL